MNGNIFDVFENQLSTFKTGNQPGFVNSGNLNDQDFVEDKEGIIRLNHNAKSSETKRSLQQAYDVLYSTF